MLDGLWQGCTLLLLATLSREPCLWQAARLDSALTVPARQWLLAGVHGQKAAGKVHEAVRDFRQQFVATLTQ